MRRVREILRLSRDAGLATREVARLTEVAPSTLREMFRRFEGSGLPWPLPPDMADADPQIASLWRGRNQARPPPADGALLGGVVPRIEAQARDPADPVGRIHRRQLGPLVRRLVMHNVRLIVTCIITRIGKLIVMRIGERIGWFIGRCIGRCIVMLIVSVLYRALS